MGAADVTFTETSLNYYVPPPNGEAAYQEINVKPELGHRPRNFSTQEYPVVIENLRGKENSVTLDTAGYQFYHHPAQHKTFNNDEEIQKEYYPESIELIKELTGASKVVLFDHTIRRNRPGQLDDGPSKRQPVSLVHVDQTPKSAAERVHLHLPPDEAPELLKKRYQIINLWRPISHVALDWPLALCDFRSVNVEKDTIPVALVYPERRGETFGVVHNPEHKWKYLRAMTPEELVLIKCFDSIRDGSVAQFTPHTAFKDPSTPADAPLRESIELRALVFYD